MAEGERGTRFLRFYERLGAAGVAPQILAVEDGALLTPKHQRLEEWLSAHPDVEDRRQMAFRVLEQADAMHQLGICHRDLHLANIVVDEKGVPLIVDPDFAVDSDPAMPCYDLYGPKPSGVHVPPDHAGYAANQGGVWWDCAAEVPTLAEAFGPLEDLRPKSQPLGLPTAPGR